MEIHTRVDKITKFVISENKESQFTVNKRLPQGA